MKNKNHYTVFCFLFLIFFIIAIYNNNISQDAVRPKNQFGIDDCELVYINNMRKTNKEMYELRRSKTLKNMKELSRKPITIAIMGSDERNEETSRSDVIMMIKYEPLNRKAIIISVPRDSRVIIPGIGLTKINAAYAHGGNELQLETLENLFNTKIDYYVHLNFKGFIKIIDSIGGVKINAEKNFYEYNDSGKAYIKKGQNILEGERLLRYVRFRYDKEGDFGRINRQQEVIISIGKSFLNPKNIIKLPKLIEILKQNVDSNINWQELIIIGRQIRDIKYIEIETYTLKTNSKKINNIWFEIIDVSYLNELSMKLNSN